MRMLKRELNANQARASSSVHTFHRGLVRITLINFFGVYSLNTRLCESLGLGVDPLHKTDLCKPKEPGQCGSPHLGKCQSSLSLFKESY